MLADDAMITTKRNSETFTEQQRLDAIERMALLYTPAEECFDRVTRLASRLFAAPIATISVVGDRKTWFKSRVGTELNEVARDDGFSAVVIQQPGPLVVPDALADPRFARCSMVVNAPYARFYAGTAIRSPDGARIGALGIIDNEPRHIADAELIYLRDLAAVVEDELHRRHLSSTQGEMIRELGEARRRSMVDPLTSVWNRAGLDSILERELAATAARRSKLSLAMIDLDHFKEVNDRFGHGTGDAVLSEVARRLRVAARPADSVARFGGEEFVVVLPDCGESDARTVGDRLRERIAAAPIVVGQSVQVNVTCSIGGATAESGEPSNVLLTRADVALYDAKHGGRNRVVVATPSMRTVNARH
jgi:diguanylate cyclase (GGDEF)-like protein